MQVFGLGDHAAVLDRAVRTQKPQAGLVHVQRARTDRVPPARQRDDGTPASCDERPENTHRCTELTNRSEIGVVVRLRGRRDANYVSLEFDVAAETAENIRHQGGDVEDVGGAIGDDTGAFGEQRRGHQLQNTVLCTTDDDLTHEPVTTGDEKAFTHNATA